MIHRHPITAAVRRQLGEHASQLPKPPCRQVSSWNLQPTSGVEPPPSNSFGQRALLLFAAGGMALGAGLHHALQQPKEVHPNLRSHVPDTVAGELVQANLLRFGFESAATRLLTSRAPHSRGLGAKFLLEHAPLESTVRLLQRHSELETDPIVEHEHPWSYPYLAPGGIEGALVENLGAVLDKNPGLTERLLAAPDRDAQRLRPLILARLPNAERALQALLASPDAIVRRRALYAFPRLSKAPRTAPAWTALVDDPDRMVRRQVCMELYALAATDKAPPAWAKAACEHLQDDSDPLVARFARGTLRGPGSLYRPVRDESPAQPKAPRAK